jgi:hypothetical protein
MDTAFFERTMQRALAEARRIVAPQGVGIVVFAHKSTGGWEAQLQAMLNAGWTMTASWPVDTECGSRLRAMNSAALASSVHLVCRPRQGVDTPCSPVGDWRDVLAELPKRIHDWMPRLSSEGIVGADAIFACLGPALEIFSRYSRVETASGETIPLGDVKGADGQILKRGYLSYVWEAVAKEALSMIFAGADTSGFEPDARLTAMWYWTLSTGNELTAEDAESAEEDAEDEGDSPLRSSASSAVKGFVLEYDAARKIAQGLGAHLEQLGKVVEVKGDKATLLSVGARAKYLFGKDEGKEPARRKKAGKQRTLFDEAGEEGDDGGGELGVTQAGATVLDRLHQSMLLFGAGRGEALKRFLVEEGAGRDQRFWRLAQALSALYPPGTEEKRWVDGVLGCKKGLGL